MSEMLPPTVSALEVETHLNDIAQSIWLEHRTAPLALIGIRDGGVPMATRLEEKLRMMGADVRRGILDITMHRDDLHNLEAMLDVGRSSMDSKLLEKRSVILLDDVVFTGRTIRAAMDELLDFGRPSRIELAVLIDRGGRELPIQPDYFGKLLPAGLEHYVEVRMAEHAAEGAADGVWVIHRNARSPRL